MESQMDDMRLELEQLTKSEKRKGALSEIEDIFEDLNIFIGRVGNEKKKTAVTLKKLEALMDADRGTVKFISFNIIS